MPCPAEKSSGRLQMPEQLLLHAFDLIREWHALLSAQGPDCCSMCLPVGFQDQVSPCCSNILLHRCTQELSCLGQ